MLSCQRLNPTFGCLFWVFVCCGLAGCITEMNHPAQSNIDKDRFVSVSIAAATEYLLEQDAEGAHRHLNRALEKDPKSAEAHNVMALVYRLTGDKKLEEKHFKLALRYDRGLSKARNNYAVFLYNEARYQEALEELTYASKDPGYPNRALAFENMGRCYLKLNQGSEAQAAFLSAIRINDQMPRAYIELAQLAYDRNQLKVAGGYIEKYGTFARHTPRSLWLGIRVQRVLGQQDALASYELALRNLFPDSPEYKRYLETQQ